ncbi:MAG: hypothetical protein C5B52_08965 [Bacteroidetes bacterium]|nr:MAG: hypothetical protein C5B52_08965 [Bacteroidota bacterium]
MRKIDALLMSVLVLYDFGAQSIVDTKITSFGQTFEVERHAVRGKKPTANPLNDVTVNYAAVNANSINNDVAKTEANALDSKASVAKFESAVAESEALSNVNADYKPSASLATVELNKEAETSKMSIESNIVEAKATKITTDASEAMMDSDNDGVINADDKCPNQTGVARFEGCPVPDTDGDGVNDEEDRCPVLAGASGNWGCPVKETESTQNVVAATENAVEESHSAGLAAKSVQFSFNSIILNNDNFNIVLQLADELISDRSLKIEIIGYTDNQGSEAQNQKVSLKRANNVGDYLRGLGVHEEQIIVKGLGSTKPVADNDTEEGRNMNRRVEFHFKY